MKSGKGIIESLEKELGVSENRFLSKLDKWSSGSKKKDVDKELFNDIEKALNVVNKRFAGLFDSLKEVSELMDLVG